MPTREPADYTAADLADPTIDAATLAQLAQFRPDLRDLVARHPNCYPDLATWIAAQQPAPAAAQLARPQPVQDPALQQMSDGARQLAAGAKDFFNTHVAPAAAEAARTMQSAVDERTAEARTGSAGWRAWVPFALPGLAVLGFISLFLPAVTVSGSAVGFSISRSVSFVQGDDGSGALMIVFMLVVLAAGIAAFVVKAKWARLTAGIAGIVVGAIVAVICLAGFGQLSSFGGSAAGFSASAAPGIGLILLLLVALLMIAAGVLTLLPQKPRALQAPQPPQAPAA